MVMERRVLKVWCLPLTLIAAIIEGVTLWCVRVKDFLFLAKLVAYWPAPIHAVALPAYTVVT